MTPSSDWFAFHSYRIAIDFEDTPLTPECSAPVRLRIPTKLGFKSAKNLQAIEVTNIYPGGFWEDQGYNWFSGSRILDRRLGLRCRLLQPLTRCPCRRAVWVQRVLPSLLPIQFGLVEVQSR